MNENQIRYLLSLVGSDIGKQTKARDRAKPDDPERGFDKAKFQTEKNDKIAFATTLKMELEALLRRNP